MNILITQAVYIDAEGTVHRRYFEPQTPCGRYLIIEIRESRDAALPAHTVWWHPPALLPAVTCLHCLAAEGLS